jgi:vacuolar-type H+-ATPase subunit I/STV1
MKKVKKKRLTKAEKVMKKINDYMNENYSFDVQDCKDINLSVISLLEKVKRENNIWTTAKGQRLAINEITDDHLDNILKHLEERAKIQAVKESVEKECESLMYEWKKNLPVCYSILLEERNRRLQRIEKMKEYTYEGVLTLTVDDKSFDEFMRRVKKITNV